jgi:flagellar hook assembly protein FlgD
VISTDKYNNIYLYGDYPSNLSQNSFDLFTLKLSQTGSYNFSNNIVNDIMLYQNYPNPFNATTEIKFNIKNDGSYTTLKIYDLLGKEIKTLFSGTKNKGLYTVNFDGNNLSSGIYFYRLLVNNKAIETRKMFLIK